MEVTKLVLTEYLIHQDVHVNRFSQIIVLKGHEDDLVATIQRDEARDQASVQWSCRVGERQVKSGSCIDESPKKRPSFEWLYPSQNRWFLAYCGPILKRLFVNVTPTEDEDDIAFTVQSGVSREQRRSGDRPRRLCP